MTAMGFTVTDGKISLENASPKLFNKEKAKLQELCDKVAVMVLKLEKKNENREN